MGVRGGGGVCVCVCANASEAFLIEMSPITLNTRAVATGGISVYIYILPQINKYNI